LDEGSIAYFQEDEDYYGKGIMLNDDFYSHTALRDNEFGYTDMEGRMTPRGRAYNNSKAMELRKRNPKEAAHPLPSLLNITIRHGVGKVIDLTEGDEGFFNAV